MVMIKSFYCRYRYTHGQWKHSSFLGLVVYVYMVIWNWKGLHLNIIQTHFERILLRSCYSVTALFIDCTSASAHLLLWRASTLVQFHSLTFTHHHVWPKDVCMRFYPLCSAWVLFTCMCEMKDVTEWCWKQFINHGHNISAHTLKSIWCSLKEPFGKYTYSLPHICPLNKTLQAGDGSLRWV